MRLDPNRALAQGTIEAMIDLFEPDGASGAVTDARVLEIALGVASEEARRAFAAAMLGAPSVRARLVRALAQVGEALGPARPDGEDLAGLGLLAAFPGTFGARDAAEVFPERFSESGSVERLASRGWLEQAGDRFALPEPTRRLVAAPAPDGGWDARFAARFLGLAKEIDRLVAEGRWEAGSAALREGLPSLRAGWDLALGAGRHEEVEAFVRRLLMVLMEAGEWEAFDDLVAAGRTASGALGPGLLRLLLSYEGAGAARRGDSPRAVGLWTERLRLARETGNAAVEADTLLDLAAQALNDGDRPAFEAWIASAEGAVEAANRPDLSASLLALLAQERGEAGDVEAAAGLAERALATLGGADGMNLGLYVRLSAARTLASCGRSDEAVRALATLLDLCVEGGRAVIAAESLAEIGAVALAGVRDAFARRCLALSYGIHRRLGTRTVDAARGRLEALVEAESAGTRETVPETLSWTDECLAILRDIREWRAVDGLTR